MKQKLVISLSSIPLVVIFSMQMLATAGMFGFVAAQEKFTPDTLDRTVLPVREPLYQAITELDTRQAGNDSLFGDVGDRFPHHLRGDGPLMLTATVSAIDSA